MPFGNGVFRVDWFRDLKQTKKVSLLFKYQSPNWWGALTATIFNVINGNLNILNKKITCPGFVTFLKILFSHVDEATSRVQPKAVPYPRHKA